MTQHYPKKEIEFDLLANALDSLHHAIDHVAPMGDEPGAKDYKQAILAVAHAVELLLKERLQREHPALIWRNVEKYPSLDAQTVSVDEAIARLESICRVKISDDDRSAIKSSKLLRNSIQHFRFRMTEKAARKSIGKMLAFILDFSDQALGYSIREELQRYDRFEDLMAIYEFYEEYYKRVEAEMRRKDKWTDTCPKCEFPSFDVRAGLCEICGHIGGLDED
jgi:hypothetical protein